MCKSATLFVLASYGLIVSLCMKVSVLIPFPKTRGSENVVPGRAASISTTWK